MVHKWCSAGLSTGMVDMRRRCTSKTCKPMAHKGPPRGRITGVQTHVQVGTVFPLASPSLLLVAFTGREVCCPGRAFVCQHTNTHTLPDMYSYCVYYVFSSPFYCLIQCHMLIIGSFQASSHCFSCPVLSRDAACLIFCSRVYIAASPFCQESSLVSVIAGTCSVPVLGGPHRGPELFAVLSTRGPVHKWSMALPVLEEFGRMADK
jgi:hypothetical protein